MINHKLLILSHSLMTLVTSYFQVYPDSLHAIITCVGGVFPVDILRHSSTGGPVTAVSFTDIYNQLAQVIAQPAAGKQEDPSGICSLSALERKTWATIREKILKQGGAAEASLSMMESAVLTLCLEDCNSPSDLADVLNAVRLGGGGHPFLRYYDKVQTEDQFYQANHIYHHTRVNAVSYCAIIGPRAINHIFSFLFLSYIFLSLYPI